jgi:hypothetical protein
VETGISGIKNLDNFTKIKKVMAMLEKRKLLAGLMGLLFAGTATAQNDIVLSLAAGRQDATKLVDAYLSPFGRSFSLGLSQNWNTTAKPLKLLRFNVQAGLSLVAVPGDEQYFNPENLGLESIRPLDTRASTLAGPSDVQTSYEVMVPDPLNPGSSVALDTLSGLTPGLGLGYVPAPFVQFNLGLVKGTEIAVRLLPRSSLNGLAGDISALPEQLKENGNLSFWGVGVKHSLSQHFPRLLKVIPIDFSAYANHCVIEYRQDVRLNGPTAADYPRGINGVVTNYRYAAGQSPADVTTQQLVLGSTASSAGLILSKKISILTPFVRAGLMRSSFSLVAEGQYDVPTAMVANSQSPGTLIQEFSALSNPVEVNTQVDNQAHYGFGLRVKLLILAAHAEMVKMGKYTTYNAGLSVGF